MKRIFVISWYYPPGNSSEGLVTYKLLKNSEYEYDVWTREDQQQNIWDRKSEEGKLSANNVRILKCPCRTNREWVRLTIDFFKKHHKEYDIIISRSMIVEDHEIAIKIKKLFPSVKWIASFGDPIVNTPYIDEITMSGQKNPFELKEIANSDSISSKDLLHTVFSPERIYGKRSWDLNKKKGNNVLDYFTKVNNKTIEQADFIILNNEYQFGRTFSDQNLSKYKKKGMIIEHSFDPELYPKDRGKQNSKKISFIYVGHLDNLRNAKCLLLAVKHLKEKDPNLKRKLEIHFYGRLGDEDKVFVFDNKLTDIIKVSGDISFLKSLEFIKKADWAILIDANFRNQLKEGIFLPAKLMDYIGARTNVFSISYPQGAVADIVKEVGGGKVVTHSPEEIYLYLSKIIYQHYTPPAYDEEKVKEYSSINLSKKFDTIIKKLNKG